MIKLPSTFTFGIAESDLQTVGTFSPQKNESAQKTMWESFAQKQGIDLPTGVGKYENSAKDAELITDLGVKAYRTSISMSRTLDKDGHVNKKAISWYRDYFEKLKAKNLQIHACLYHWEAPEAFLSDGILDSNFLSYYLKHVKVVLENLSDVIDYFIPVNELWCMSYLSYYLGIHAPGYKDIEKFFHAYVTGIDIQTKAIELIKSTSNNHKVGVVNIHFPSYLTMDAIHSPEYISARHVADYLTNYLYSDPFFFGSLEEDTIKKFKEKFPSNYKDVIKNAKVGDQLDYYGVNYYNSQYIKPSTNELGFEWYMPEPVLTNSLGWPVALPPHYPAGLTDILVGYTQRYEYSGLKRLVVSENGTPLYTDNRQDVPSDDFRIFFISEHIKQIQAAIAKGAKVDGYFLWTLLDNYEWQEGFKPESAFGIIAVDRQTGARKIKKSYSWYQKLVKDFYSNL